MRERGGRRVVRCGKTKQRQKHSLFTNSPVVAVVCQGGLGADQQDAPVEAEGPAVVADAPVGGGQADIDEDAG